MTAPDKGTPDDELAHELGAMIAAVDGVPDTVVAAAEGAWTWRTIDAELAELVFDSTDPLLAAPNRGATDRRLSFRYQDSVVDIEVADEQLLVLCDSDGLDVVCETPAGEAWRAVIEGGECEGEVPEERPLRLRLMAGDQPITVTPWFLHHP